MTALRDIREDFRVIAEPGADGRRIVYLDNACQSLRPRSVVDTVTDYYDHLGACGRSGEATNSLARLTTERCEHAREQMARLLGSRPHEVVWQPNTTHGLNLVLRSLTLRSCPADLKLTAGDEIVTTDLEHHSGYLPLWLAAEEAGIRIRVVPVDREGRLDLQQFEAAMRPRTRLIACLWSSNMTGSILPVPDITRIAHDHGAKVIVDGAQHVPHHAVDVKRLGIDFLAFSVHKMCGPAGMGVLFGREELLERLPPVTVGGETVADVTLNYDSEGIAQLVPEFLSPPFRFEPGLQDFPGIIGSGVAAEYLRDRVGMERIEDVERDLGSRLLGSLRSLPAVSVLGPSDPRSTDREALVTFRLPHVPEHPRLPEELAAWMEDRVPGHRIMLRTSGHEVHPFHRKLGISELRTTRVSPYFYNTREEVDLFGEALAGFLDHRHLN